MVCFDIGVLLKSSESIHHKPRHAYNFNIADYDAINGKPRSGHIYEIMKITRAKFKLALRYCKTNEERFRCDALARDHLSNNGNFCKKVKRKANAKATRLAECFGGVTGEQDIANMWKENYENLYNVHDNTGVYHIRDDVL